MVFGRRCDCAYDTICNYVHSRFTIHNLYRNNWYFRNIVGFENIQDEPPIRRIRDDEGTRETTGSQSSQISEQEGIYDAEIRFTQNELSGK